MKKSEQKTFLAELARQQMLVRKHRVVAESPHTGEAGRAWAQKMQKQASDNIDSMLKWAGAAR